MSVHHKGCSLLKCRAAWAHLRTVLGTFVIVSRYLFTDLNPAHTWSVNTVLATRNSICDMKAALLDSLAPPLMLVIIMYVLSESSAEGCPDHDWVILTHHHICAVRGSSVVMPCSLTPSAGKKATNVFWLINAKEGKDTPDIADKPSYHGRVKYYWKKKNNNKNNCTLKLTDVKLTDRAEYRAIIIAGKDKWQSCSAVLLSVTDLTVSIPTPVMKGGDVRLSCNNGCGLNSNPTVIWRKNGEDLPGKQTDNSELLLQRVSTEDEGNYSCALKGHEGHPSKPRKLNAMFSPKNISVSLSPAGEIHEGSTVTLTCSSDANPPVENYTWFKLNESTPVGSGQQYSITNISSEDGGQYYCVARNKYGAGNSSAVSITVTDLGARSPVLYVVAGVSVCGAAGLICVLVWIRRKRRASSCDSGTTGRNTQDDVDYENDPLGRKPGSVQMSSVYEGLNPNTTQPDPVYQTLNPNTIQPDAVYQSLNPNTTQPVA
ncbi:sialic acid-binding Ig-like lectin 14 [Alosa pseudoharengus]|uniref:sialic acid-binding Ig-like lectin 14 n=1 Tax=Alosa pseudoharengus TaxID=34774 RepID=UPI003F88E43A